MNSIRTLLVAACLGCVMVMAIPAEPAEDYVEDLDNAEQQLSRNAEGGDAEMQELVVRANNAISGVFRGERATFDRVVATKTIHWKQGSFLGFGGDRSQTYKECNYKMDNGKLIVVFIQSSWSTPDPLLLDGKLQYGLNSGNIFFVLHDKEQKPYQHRFQMTPMQSVLYWGNEVLKKIKGYDASWIMGDYLHNL